MEGRRLIRKLHLVVGIMELRFVKQGDAAWIIQGQGLSSKGILAFPPVGDADVCVHGQMA